MGPTKVFKTIYDQPNSLRGMFGTTDTRNATHGSDSEDNARIEMKFFFPEFDPKAWHTIEEENFLKGQIIFDENSTEHKLTSML